MFPLPLSRSRREKIHEVEVLTVPTRAPTCGTGPCPFPECLSLNSASFSCSLLPEAPSPTLNFSLNYLLYCKLDHMAMLCIHSPSVCSFLSPPALNHLSQATVLMAPDSAEHTALRSLTHIAPLSIISPLLDDELPEA